MKDLFKKYLDNHCSPEENKEILGYFNAPENEITVRCLIAETMENDEDEDDGDQWDHISDEMFAVLKEQVDPPVAKLVPISRRIWFRVAAAVILLVGGFALYNLINNTNQQQDIAKADILKQPMGDSSYRAVLTLGDGSTISLETAENGMLSQQGNTKILKVADGQLSYKALNEKPTEVLFNSIVTPRGGQYQVILSDGTKIWINAASTLRFPATFSGKERKVALTGEAYFEVAKNATMPFVVAVADRGEVEVLGTHFNVNAYSDEVSVNTTLLEGSVKVRGLTNSSSQIIIPGEQARLDSNGQIFIDKKANTEGAVAWKNGAFDFKNADLGEVLRQLSRWYDVDIVFEGLVPQRHFTGEMPRDVKLPQVIKLLEKNSVSCRLEGNKLIVLQ